VLSAILAGDVATVSVRLSRAEHLGRPIAPADLRETDPYRLVFPFHQLVGRDGSVLLFETYSPAEPLQEVGSTHTFSSWLLPAAFDALLDLAAVWTLADYPDDDDHDHCLFTWEAISAHGGRSPAYHSEHGWITADAYRDFIEADILRIRRRPRSIEAAV
jgi:hypothetical protein